MLNKPEQWSTLSSDTAGAMYLLLILKVRPQTLAILHFLLGLKMLSVQQSSLSNKAEQVEENSLSESYDKDLNVLSVEGRKFQQVS